MSNKVVLVTGMSGAGKSTAMRVLEDMGYYTIDNYPVSLVDNLVELIESTNDIRYKFVALATSANDFAQFVKGLKSDNITLDVLYLDANDNVLLHRYKSTRRIHPFLLSNVCNTLEDAITYERNLFAKNINNAFVTIDTSFLSEKEFRNKIEQFFSRSKLPTFSISFISFGYKYGVPMDADLMFDVRFLPNPYWDLNLRTFSGNDENVYNYVMDKPETKEFIKHLISFTDYAFEQYKNEGKNHFTVAIGCTGGQHRSVTITNFLYDYYKDKYNCYKEHRDEREWITNVK